MSYNSTLVGQVHVHPDLNDEEREFIHSWFDGEDEPNQEFLSSLNDKELSAFTRLWGWGYLIPGYGDGGSLELIDQPCKAYKLIEYAVVLRKIFGGEFGKASWLGTHHIGGSIMVHGDDYGDTWEIEIDSQIVVREYELVPKKSTRVGVKFVTDYNGCAVFMKVEEE